LLPQQFSITASYMTNDVIRPLQWMLVAGLIVLVVRRALRPESSNLMIDYATLLVCLSIGTMVTIAAQRVVPYERTWLMYLPLVLIPSVLWAFCGAADAMQSTAVRSLVAALWRMAWVVCIGVQVMYLNQFMPLRDWMNLGEFVDAKPIAEFLVKQNITRDRVDVSVPEGAPLDYYFRRFGGAAFSDAAAQKEFFVVDRAVRDVEDLTHQPVELIFQVLTGEVYQIVQE
jgi:hypothetical protein